MDHGSLIKHHPLFERMNEEEIMKIFSCFSFHKKDYAKNEYILLEGDSVQLIGIILRGTVLMEKNDFYGNNYLFMELREKDIFAEPFMGLTIQPSAVNYKAVTNCSVLFFHYRDMWRPCTNNCLCHSVFTENLMNLLAMKSRNLLNKIEILSKKSLRDRIMTFLNILYRENQTASSGEGRKLQELPPNQLFVPYNHTELAEYLGVNRSALVRELKRMRDEHLIEQHKNIITINQQ